MAVSHTPSPGRKSDKIWRDALMLSAKRTQEEAQALANDDTAPLIQRAAAQVMLAAAAGEKDAYKEIGDRIDGKPKQQTELTAGDDADGNAIPLGISVSFVKPAS